jgi:predicted ester cyclase
MSAEDNKALIRRMYEITNQRNWDEFDEMFAPDYVHHSAPGHDMKLEDLKQVMAMSTMAFPDLQATIDEMIAEGDKVMVRWDAECHAHQRVHRHSSDGQAGDRTIAAPER